MELEIIMQNKQDLIREIACSFLYLESRFKKQPLKWRGLFGKRKHRGGAVGECDQSTLSEFENVSVKHIIFLQYIHVNVKKLKQKIHRERIV
jgi:hypothetical protein